MENGSPFNPIPDWLTSVLGRREFGLFTTLFLFSFCLFGFLDIAPTRIFTSSGASCQENRGWDIPPCESFTSFPNLAPIILLSFSVAAVVLLVYYWSDRDRKFTFGVSFLSYLAIFIWLETRYSVEIESPARVFGMITVISSISLLCFVYTASEQLITIRSSDEVRIDRYLDSQWRRLRISLFAGVAVPFTGAVTFASTTDGGPIPIVLLSGIFLTPALGVAGFYLHRILLAEEILGLR